jgi:hypothetical protein
MEFLQQAFPLLIKIHIFVKLRCCQCYNRVTCTRYISDHEPQYIKRCLSLLTTYVNKQVLYTESVVLWALYLGVFTVPGASGRMAARLQLQVPACRLLEQSCGSASKDNINYKYLLTKKKPIVQITTC